MVAYKKSATTLVFSAAVAAAQNGTHPYAPTEMTYTTVIPSLCPTGLVPHTYTIKQQCDYPPCEQPAVPYGWEVKTKYCAEGCGPAPTYVPVTECPWENPAPTPACYGEDCYRDEVVCPEGNTYTNWYHKPTPAPEPTPVPEPYTPKCEGEGCYPPPSHPEPKPYPTPSHPEPKPYPPKCEGEGCNPPSHPEPTPYTPSGCEGPQCPPVCPGPYCPDVVTKVYPPTNNTVPHPPMYTGAGVKTAASGVLGFIAVAIVAFL
ncbi:hypothetical protein TWF730_005630 [Orbilia blumenaviensis]|uniref:Uncharacterized protein n=1 Tax=Orbilia blumenaviensis TaxID=1796055 RepID=A0AAV9VJC2_9PEZI